MNLHLTSQFVDSAYLSLVHGDVALCLPWIISMGVCYLISNFLEQLLSYFQELQTQNINIHLNDIMIGKIESMDLSSFDDPVTYNHIEQVNQDALHNLQGILDSFIVVIRHLISFISVSIIVWQLKPVIILFCFISTIPMIVVRMKTLLLQYNIYRNRLEKIRFVQYIRNLFFQYNTIKEIKIFRTGQYLKNIIVKTLGEHRQEDKKIRFSFLVRLTATDIIQVGLSFLIRIYAVVLAIQKQLTIGTLSMYTNAIGNLESSIREILNTIMYITITCMLIVYFI